MSEASGTKAIVAIKEEVRLREWQRVYEEWRASGQSVREWCEENGVAPSTFYHRLRRIREKLCEEYGKEKTGKMKEHRNGNTTHEIIPAKSSGIAPVAFNEGQSVVPVRSISSPEIMIESGDIRINIKGGISTDSISAIIGALKRC